MLLLAGFDQCPQAVALALYTSPRFGKIEIDFPAMLACQQVQPVVTQSAAKRRFGIFVYECPDGLGILPCQMPGNLLVFKIGQQGIGLQLMLECLVFFQLALFQSLFGIEKLLPGNLVFRRVSNCGQGGAEPEWQQRECRA